MVAVLYSALDRNNVQNEDKNCIRSYIGKDSGVFGEGVRLAMK